MARPAGWYLRVGRTAGPAATGKLRAQRSHPTFLLQVVAGHAPFAPLQPSSYTVPTGSRRERADKVLAHAFPEHSRAAIQRAMEAGLVKADGRVIDQSQEVQAGQTLEFSLPETVAAELRPVDIPLEVIFEDKHLIVLNKAAGMVVHPGTGTGEDTMVHALLAHCAGELSGIGGVERPGIVHRLDKETSGLLVVAKNDAAHRALADQFASRTLKKEYLALVSGVPKAAAGTIDRSIARHPVHRHRMTTGEGGRPSRTEWAVEKKFGERAALVRCRIHTGRTHQIRVHLKSLGHPLLGDATYGWKQDPKLPVPPRVMLHAEHLVFTHPVTGKIMDLTAPLPKDFKQTLTALRKL
jgi:23S rRNA pseudouridine1911/1915/1917 synthase